jgi:hypothetical protein
MEKRPVQLFDKNQLGNVCFVSRNNKTFVLSYWWFDEDGAQMPYELPLLPKLKSEGWKIKVYDNEIREDPHVTIIRKTQHWRWAIRLKTFMDTEPDPKKVPKEILALLTDEYRSICLGWNEVHPADPVEVPPDPNAAEMEEEEDE